MEHHRLEDLDDYFDIGISHHRAVSDCETTNVVLKKLAAIVAKRQIDLSNRGKWGKVDLRALSPESDSVVVDSPLYKKVCVFTGALERYSRVDAAQIVVNLGGLCGNNVTKATNFLIVGDFDYSNASFMICCPTSKKFLTAKNKSPHAAAVLFKEVSKVDVCCSSCNYSLLERMGLQ